MEWQQLVSLIIVVAAAVLLLAGQFRRRTFSFERDTHCGCSASHSSPNHSSVVFHARKGERPKVIMKMR